MEIQIYTQAVVRIERNLILRYYYERKSKNEINRRQGNTRTYRWNQSSDHNRWEMEGEWSFLQNFGNNLEDLECWVLSKKEKRLMTVRSRCKELLSWLPDGFREISSSALLSISTSCISQPIVNVLNISNEESMISCVWLDLFSLLLRMSWNDWKCWFYTPKFVERVGGLGWVLIWVWTSVHWPWLYFVKNEREFKNSRIKKWLKF